jgi:hypothetical protein
MKVNIEIVFTPDEARAFLGLPDIAPLQQEVLSAMQERMVKNLEVLDPVAVWKSWFPVTSQGLEDLRKAFTGAVKSGAAKSGASRESAAKEREED